MYIFTLLVNLLYDFCFAMSIAKQKVFRLFAQNLLKWVKKLQKGGGVVRFFVEN